MNPVQWWQARRRKRQEARVIEAIMTLDQQGRGMDEAWAEPGTTPEDIAGWFDEFMGNSPHVLARNVPEIEGFWFVAANVDEQQWEAGPPAEPLPDSRLYIAWNGTRTEWWASGRDAIRAAIPPDHHGVYVCANSVGRLFAAMRGRPTAHSSLSKNGA